MKSVLAAVVLFSLATANAATITVNSAADDTIVNGQCTLREAIIAANSNTTTGDCTQGTAGADTIVFAIGSGIQTINLLTALPAITEQVTIDGTTQPGSGGTPIIELNGAGIVGSAAGLTLTANGNTITGLVINRFSFLGINILSANNVITNNYIGTDVNGMVASPNAQGGIGITGAAATGNTIGSTAFGVRRNVISGNGGNGVTITSQTIGNNVVQGNTIGLNAIRTAALANSGHGVDIISTSANTVGGTTAAAMNEIAGNGGAGVHMQATSNNVVQGNLIGLFSIPAGNRLGGVVIDTSSNNNTVGATTSGGSGGNTIIGNGGGTTIGAGVRVTSGTGNRISTNSMSFNFGTSGAIAIDLGTDGSTPNDACDPDSGPNNVQNFPVIAAAAVSGSTTAVTGTLNSTASSTFTIEFFSSPPAAFDQGVTFLGSTTVTTTAGCTAAFAVQLPSAVPTSPVPYSITATATDTANNTSEMSAVVLAAPALTAVKSFAPASIHAGETSTLTLTITNPGPGTVSALAVSDTYPSGLVNAAGTPTTTCGGTITATAGGGSFSLSGGSLAAGASCQATVFVTSAAAATYTNTIPIGGISGSYTSPQPTTTTPTTNAAAVSAAVTVALFPPPSVTKSFATPSIGVNGTSRLTITLTNGNSTAITGVTFTDALPSGLTVATTPNPADSCGGTLTANAGSGAVTLSGGTIPANGSCTVAVDVTANAPGTFTNTIAASAVTSTNAQPNSAPASASLQVVSVIPAMTPLGLLLLAITVAAIALLRLRA